MDAITIQTRFDKSAAHFSKAFFARLFPLIVHYFDKRSVYWKENCYKHQGIVFGISSGSLEKEGKYEKG